MWENDRTIYTHCTDVKFLALLSYYNYIKANHWEKPGEGYVRPVCTIYATSFESIIISKLKAIKNLTYIKHLD